MLEKVYDVTAHYETPRIIMVAEEWIEISEKVKTNKKPKGGGGLFGGALDDVAAEIAGEKSKKVAKLLPTYSISLLADQIEVNGKYPMSFRVARSLWDDILESKVIYEATGTKGRVLSASVVFFQMQKNKAEGKSSNRLLFFDASGLNRLKQISMLWPKAKVGIKKFHTVHKGWLTVLPKDPVMFFDERGKVQYAAYAWFHVDPLSGHIIGVLPREINGGESDARQYIEKKALGLTKKMIEKAAHPATGVVKTFLSTVAGMYVSSAGVLSGLDLTLADPALANMSDKEWKKFLSLHSMDFCNNFLEEYSDIYDSYETMAGFWMGACAIANRLGGAGAGGICLKNGYDALRKKAVSDMKAAGEKALSGRVESWNDSKRRDIAKLLNDTKDAFVDISKKLGNTREGIEALENL
jgi:hypothetical protein